MDIGDDYEKEIADLLGQVQRILDTCEDAISFASLRSSFKRVNNLKATLAERMNSKVLVNRLPDELLVEVFKHAVHNKEPCPTFAVDLRDDARVATGQLLWLTHVCRRWRRAALGYRLLWQRIDCYHPEQLREFAIYRSYPGPLSLFVNIRRYNGSDDKDALRVVLTHSDRLQRLDIVCDLRTRESLVQSQLLDMWCPNLSCLTVNKQPPAEIMQFPIIVSRKSIFCGGLSRLRALAISPVSDWLPANPLPALTHLYLSFYWSTDLCTSFILSFLGSAPALEVLHLSHFFFSREDDKQGLIFKPVPLDRLKYVLFSDRSDFQCALALLDQLVIPRSARTYLDCVNIHTESPASILPPLSSTAETEALTIHRRRATLQVAAEGRNCGFWLYGKESAESHSDHFTTWLTHLPTMFPLSRLSYLQLQLGECASEAIVRVLRETVSLRTLEVGISSYPTETAAGMDSFVHICHALSQESGTIRIMPSLCPELRVLTIGLHGRSTPALDYYTRRRNAIRSMLRARSRLGHPILRLAVQPFDMTPAVADLEYEGVGEFIGCVLADYASLAEHVEDFALYRLGDEPMAFPLPAVDWDEVERYWTVPQDDRPERRIDLADYL